MRVRTYQIIRTQVGFIDVREDQLEDGDDWEEAAYELITNYDFEVVDDEIDFIMERDEA